MILRPDKDDCFTISFFLIPEYAMVALLSAIETLRVANRFAGKEVFRWQLLSENGEVVVASNDLALQKPLSIYEIDTPDNVFIYSSFHPERYINDNLINWVRGLSRKGVTLGAVDTGCYLLAAANLLKGRDVTLHWEAVPAFLEDYPDVRVTNELFEISQNLITCAGGTSAIDMMLHIIQTELGDELAIAICEQFIKNGIRQKSDKQRMGLAARLKIHHPRLLKVLATMEENLEDPISPVVLAEQAHLSIRQLERLFRSHLDNSPSGYYMQLRLERARHLLRESHLSVAEIAAACGFNSGPHFTRSYRNHFNLSPSEDRN